MSDRDGPSPAESAKSGLSPTHSHSSRPPGWDESDWYRPGQATDLGSREDSASPHLPGSSQGATPDMEGDMGTAEGDSPLPVGVPTTAPLYSIGSITSSVAVGGDYDYGHGRPSAAPDRNDLSASEATIERGSAIGGTSSHTQYGPLKQPYDI